VFLPEQAVLTTSAGALPHELARAGVHRATSI
jgi:hypothetical protein